MKLRSTLPAALTGAVLAAAVALPAVDAAAVTAPAAGAAGSPAAAVTATPTESGSLTDSPSASASASPSTTTSPTDTGSATPSATATTPWDASAWVNQVGNYRYEYWKLSFYAGTSSPITSMVAHFRPVGAAAGTADAGTTTSFTPDPYSPAWISASEVSLPHVGTYDVEIDITEADGAVATFPDAGQFTYAATLHFGTLTADRSFADFTHRTYTVSAPVTLTNPSSGAALDPTGIAVTLTDPNNAVDPGETATVGADGRIAATVTAKGAANYQVYEMNGVGAGTTAAGVPYHYDYATPSELTVPAKKDPSRIRILSPTDVRLAPGGSTVIRGVLEFQQNGMWAGAGGQDLQTGSNGTCSGIGNVTTAADGTFTLPVSTAGAYAFCNWWDYSPFLSDSDSNSTPVAVHIPAPTGISGFTVSEDEYGEAVIDGHLTGTNWGVGMASVLVQYSPDGRTWRNVGWTKVGRDNLASNEFLCYATYTGQANGYWRAYYPGTADYQPSYSRAVHIFRYPTRITGGHPNHTSVGRGARVTFSGHVQQHLVSGRWIAERAGNALLVFRPHGSSTWYAMAKARLNSAGAFTVSARAPMSGTWAVVWFTPDSAHIDSTGPMTYIHA